MPPRWKACEMNRVESKLVPEHDGRRNGQAACSGQKPLRRSDQSWTTAPYTDGCNKAVFARIGFPMDSPAQRLVNASAAHGLRIACSPTG
jgi:hypothetical protein